MFTFVDCVWVATVTAGFSVWVLVCVYGCGFCVFYCAWVVVGLWILCGYCFDGFGWFGARRSGFDFKVVTLVVLSCFDFVVCLCCCLAWVLVLMFACAVFV